MRKLLSAAIFASFLLASSALEAQSPASSGEVLYQQHCSLCHDKGVPRAPTLADMRKMSPEAVVRSMVGGLMVIQGAALKPDEKRAVARFVAGQEFATAADESVGRCQGSFPELTIDSGPRWEGWGGPDNARHQPEAELGAADLPRLKVKWAFGFPGASLAYGAPTVVGGRVFVGSVAGDVYSLDASTGCVHWRFGADGSVRAAPRLGRLRGGRIVVVVADQSAVLYALDAKTGALVWKTRIDDQIMAGVTGSPAWHEGRLYVPITVLEDVLAPDPKYPCCRSRGAVAAVDVETGAVLWKTHTVVEPPTRRGVNKAGTDRWGPSGASVWGSPTVDPARAVVYAGTGNNHSNPPTDTSDSVIAFDMATGRIVWKRQLHPGGDAWNNACITPERVNCPENEGPDHDIGAAPILRTLANGKRVLLVGQKSSQLHALDPDDGGALLWSHRLGRGGPLGGIEWGMSADGKQVYAALADMGFTAAGMDPKVGGGLFAYGLADGKLSWRVEPDPCGDRPGCSPAQSQAVTSLPGVVLSGSVGGVLRAYAAVDGRVLWSFDTVQEFATVNGVKATGGALNGAGPVVAGGRMFVNSGYGRFGQLPGNVLLCFSVDGR